MVKKNNVDKFFRNISSDVVEEIFNLPDSEVRRDANEFHENSKKMVATFREDIEELISSSHKERQKIWRQKAQKKQNNFSSKIVAATSKWVDLSITDIKEEIRAILVAHGNNLALEYRDFEKLDKEHLLKILSDLEALSINNEGTEKE